MSPTSYQTAPPRTSIIASWNCQVNSWGLRGWSVFQTAPLPECTVTGCLTKGCMTETASPRKAAESTSAQRPYARQPSIRDDVLVRHDDVRIKHYVPRGKYRTRHSAQPAERTAAAPMPARLQVNNRESGACQFHFIPRRKPKHGFIPTNTGTRRAQAAALDEGGRVPEMPSPTSFGLVRIVLYGLPAESAASTLSDPLQ